MSTDTKRTAEEICNALDMTLEEVNEASELVERRIAFMDQSETIPSSSTFGDVTVHLHQLVVDPSGTHFVVVDVGDDRVEVARREDWTRYAITGDEFADGNVVPRTGVNGTPIFAY